MSTAASSRPRARGRGESAGLDLRQILDAARTLDPDALTMQAVADVLNVNRKALNHHVKDRATLLGIVALDAFSAGFSSAEVSAAEDWRSACRIYAVSFTEAVAGAGDLAAHLWFGDALTSWFLDPTEALFAKFDAAGFSGELTTRLVALLSSMCLAHARDVTQAAHTTGRPRANALRTALDGVDVNDYENLARISALGVDTYDRAQLELTIDVFLTGAEAMRLREASAG